MCIRDSGKGTLELMEDEEHLEKMLPLIPKDVYKRQHNDCDTYVVMEVEGSTVILNGADDAQTWEKMCIRDRSGRWKSLWMPCWLFCRMRAEFFVNRI